MGLKLTDKLVARMLQKRGYQETTATIFISSVKTWFIMWLFFLAQIPILGYLFYLGMSANFYVCLILILYLAISYLANAKSNNSFAITDKELLVINPYFPFRRFSVIPLETIDILTIDKSKWEKWGFFLMFPSSNFIQIHTKEKIYKYYCIGLDIDYSDSFEDINWAEKTLDDLHSELKNKKILVTFKLLD